MKQRTQRRKLLLGSFSVPSVVSLAFRLCVFVSLLLTRPASICGSFPFAYFVSFAVKQQKFLTEGNKENKGTRMKTESIGGRTMVNICVHLRSSAVRSLS